MKSFQFFLFIIFLIVSVSFAQSPGGKSNTVATEVSRVERSVDLSKFDGAKLMHPPTRRNLSKTAARSDRLSSEAISTAKPLQVHLQNIPANERSDTRITFEYPSENRVLMRQLTQIRDLWNRGEYRLAQSQLAELEKNGQLDQIILNVAWKTPRKIVAPAWGTDVEINSRTSARAVSMDFDEASGNLFALVRYQTVISMNYSSDNGQSWFQTYTSTITGTTAHRFTDADLTVSQNYVYMAKATTIEPGDPTVVRFFTGNGQRETGYYENVGYGLTADQIKLVSNKEGYDNRIYMFIIGVTDNFHCFWTDENATNWNEVNTGITYANHNYSMSAVMDPGYAEGETDYYVWFSYRNNAGLIVVAGVRTVSSTISIEKFTFDQGGVSSIGAYRGVVLVAYEHNFNEGTGIKYQISYNGGDSWYWGAIAEPASSSHYYEYPTVTLRKGSGIGIAYQEESGAFDPCWFRHRDYGSGPSTAAWTAPEQFNEQDVVTGFPMQIEWVPPLTGSSFAYGVGWCGGPDVRAYFDRLDGGTIPMTLRIYNPNNGEVWFVGNNYAINWEASSYIGQVRVEISTNNGLSWWAIKTVANDGQTHYTPVVENVSGQCLMRVIYVDDETVRDETDYDFTIVEASYIKQYTANKLPTSTAVPVIDGNFNDNAWNFAGDAAPLHVGGNPGDYLIPWSDLANNDVRYRALWSAETNMLYIAVAVTDNRAGASDNGFNELYNDDTVEFFVDGDQSKLFYQDNYSRAQQWLVRRDNKKHLGYLPGEYTGGAITSAVQYGANGNFNLEVAMKIFEEYPGRVKNLAIGDVIGWDVWYDDSDNNVVRSSKFVRERQVGWGYMGHAWHNEAAFQEMYFGPEIAVCDIQVTSPNGGETVACACDIVWSSTLTSGSVKIEYWCDGAWKSVIHSTPDDGHFHWEVPPGTNCPASKIKITDRNNSGCFDTSDNDFSISCPPGECLPPYVKALDAGGLTGTTIVVPIEISENPTPIDAFGLTFAYCYPKLSLIGVERGTLTQGYSFFEGTENTHGFINIGGFNSTAIPANSHGTIARVILSVASCTEGETCAFEIQNLLDDLTGMNACPGTFLCAQTCVLGDVNMDEALTPGDALCAFQIYLNGGTPPPGECDNDCALYAADTNCDGVVTPGDALIIFEGYLGGKTLPLECPPLAKMDATSYRLKLDDVYETADQQLVVPIQVANPRGLRAFGFDLGFPAEALKFVGIQRNQLTENWHEVAAKPQMDGVVTVGGFNAEAIAAEKTGLLLSLVFEPKTRTQPAGEIWLFNLKDDLKAADVSRLNLNTLQTAANQPIPMAYALKQNYPNPFNMETEIEYHLPEAGRAEVSIFNSLGQRIRTLVSTQHEAGTHTVKWDGRDQLGQGIPSGIYFYRLTTPKYSEMRKMLVIR